MCQDVKKQSRVKRKELNKLLGYTVRHLKDKVCSFLICVAFTLVLYIDDLYVFIDTVEWALERLVSM